MRPSRRRASKLFGSRLTTSCSLGDGVANVSGAGVELRQRGGQIGGVRIVRQRGLVLVHRLGGVFVPAADRCHILIDVPELEVVIGVGAVGLLGGGGRLRGSRCGLRRRRWRLLGLLWSARRLLGKSNKRSPKQGKNERAMRNFHVHQANGNLDARSHTAGAFSILGYAVPR